VDKMSIAKSENPIAKANTKLSADEISRYLDEYSVLSSRKVSNFYISLTVYLCFIILSIYFIFFKNESKFTYVLSVIGGFLVGKFSNNIERYYSLKKLTGYISLGSAVLQQGGLTLGEEKHLSESMIYAEEVLRRLEGKRKRIG
jgi:hypothetical protein